MGGRGGLWPPLDLTDVQVGNSTHQSRSLPEAAINLSLVFKARHPEIPWQEIAGFRNRIMHGRFGFNLDMAWEVVPRICPS